MMLTKDGQLLNSIPSLELISKVNKISPKDINSINKFKSAIDVYNATLVTEEERKELKNFWREYR